ncbi:hypothetical protein [Microvirga subterranea]|uniref:Uncharacterized protein n=1 Tax=Microvirga subterranea TaxID=186651 RepID=A0A370HSA8_9HYPH|nr:hypothetical protein [Microvirga subterranea]RDI59824.1 hypothetical protein DES45_10379 [Microvirga subterranea]
MKHILAGALAGCLALAFFTPWASSYAQENGRPVVVEALEHGFSGFFLLTTTGDGNYDVFQRVEDGLGIPETGNAVCLFHETCYLEIAHLPREMVGQYDGGGSNLGPVRLRASVVRDAYATLRMAGPDKRSTSVDAWHDAISRFDACLRNGADC